MGYSKIGSILLILSLLLSLFSFTAAATPAYTVYVGGVKMTDNTYLPQGATQIQTTQPAGGYAHYHQGILTLKDFTYEGMGLYDGDYDDYSGIYAIGDLTLRLLGDNVIDTTPVGDGYSYGIMADTLIIEAGAYDSLTVLGTYSGISTVADSPTMTLKGGTVTAYGDAWGALGDVTVENGSLILSNGDTRDELYDDSTSFSALYGSLRVGESLSAYGSSDPTGADPTSFVAAQAHTYDYIRVEGESIFVAGIEMTNRSYLPVGATAIQNTKPTGGYAYFANGVLTLRDFTYEGIGYYHSYWDDYSGISAEIPLELRLKGENSFTVYGTEGKTAYGLVASTLAVFGEENSSLYLYGGYAGLNTTAEVPTVVLNSGKLHCEGQRWGAIAMIQGQGGTFTLQNRDATDEMYYDSIPYSALYGELTVGEGLEVIGSYDPQGSNAMAYVPADLYKYDYLCLQPKYPEPVTDMGIKFNHTLNLASDISINFVIAKSLLTGYDMDNAYVECEIPNYVENTPSGTEKTILYPVLRGSYYYFTFNGLNAVRMNDLVTARFYGTKDGVPYVSPSDTYSVGTYAYTQLGKATSAYSLKVLCANLLRYGSMAQQYKSYRTDALVDLSMTLEELAYLTDLETVAFDLVNQTIEDLPDPKVTWAGKSLNLDSKVTIKYVINLSDYTGDPNNLSLRLAYEDIDGVLRSVTLRNPIIYNVSKGQYAFDFDGLLAAELRQKVDAAVYLGEERVSAVLQYSASSYGNNKTGMLLELCKCLMAYSDAAREYFS